MKKLRKILRKVLMTIGASVISVIFQACYGPIEGWDDIFINGTVKCKETEQKIEGIKVTVWGFENDWRETDINGEFYFYLPKEDAEKYILQFDDVDGETNGWYESLTKEIEILEDQYYYKVNIELDEKSSNN